jgi:hypothetical protein
MKHLLRPFLVSALLCVCSGAFAQQSSLLAKCLGEPLATYGKAFGDKMTEEKKTPGGSITVGDYKTGSAAIEVIQKAGSKRPEVINVSYYQEPKRDWKLALTDIGLSPAGVTAKEDSKHYVHLTHIKAGKSLKVEAIFIPMDSEHKDGPELHMTIR